MSDDPRQAPAWRRAGDLVYRGVLPGRFHATRLETDVIPHKTRIDRVRPRWSVDQAPFSIEDGVVVDHEIRTGRDEVDFKVVATNPTKVESEAQWAQPCIRVDRTRVRRRTQLGSLSAAVFHLRRRQADAAADDALGPHGALHARAGLVSRGGQPR